MFIETIYIKIKHMKKLFNFIIYAIILFYVFGCCAQRKSTSNEILGSSMKIELHIEKASTAQVDSLIIADTLPSLNKWISSIFIDDNTKEVIVKRMYIKQHSSKHEVLYLVNGDNEPFEIIKRVEKK